jgi:hypothetical protein
MISLESWRRVAWLTGMDYPFRPRLALSLCASASLWLMGAGVLSAAEDSSEITAVFATVANGYERTKLPDGTFKPETYTFGEGGFMGIPLGDNSVDAKSFRSIAQTVAPSLSRAAYVTSHDPQKTDLLIMVYWGTSGADARSSGGFIINAAPIPPPPPPPPVIVAGNGQVVVVAAAAPPAQPASSPEQGAFDAMAAMQNRQRDRDNVRNAQMLGYDEELGRASVRPESRRYLDLVDEVEDTRYFIVLRAYDFQLMWKEKKRKALWEVRYSIRARDHLFGDALTAMTDMASRYFGQDSKGLVRREVPVGRVRMGDTIFKGTAEPEEKK